MMTTIRYFSMFSGIGGFEYGIEKAETQTQFECVGYSEIDDYAVKIYERHYPEQINYGDATRINTKDLPSFEFLVGGFPCQAFSLAGKRKGFEDTRGTLFFEIARVLRDKKPARFLLENVKGLLSHDRGRTVQTIFRVCDELGYDVSWKVYNSKDYGVPQNRERIFIKGYFREKCGPEVLSVRRKDYEDNEIDNRKLHRINNTSQVNSVYGVDGLSPCLDTWGELKIDDGNSIRKATPVECERLQGFPDDWTRYGKDNELISNTQRYKCCGNAVTTNVVKEIIEEMFP